MRSILPYLRADRREVELDGEVEARGVGEQRVEHQERESVVV